MESPIYKLEKVVQGKEELQDFEGPLDLILFLLSKNKIEIHLTDYRMDKAARMLVETDDKSYVTRMFSGRPVVKRKSVRNCPSFTSGYTFLKTPEI